MKDEYLTPEQVATLLKVSVDTLRYWRYTRTGPKAHRVGRHVRYASADVDRWLERQTTGVPTDA